MKAFVIAALMILACGTVAWADEGGQTVMVKDIHWLGHDTFKITGNKVIYTDPFQLNKEDSADIILITHEHRDHCSPDDVAKIQKPHTVIVTVSDCAKKLGGNIKIIRPGDKLTVGGIDIEAVPAYNLNKQFHTRDRGWAGYIFTVDGRRIYIAGDTDRIPEMKGYKCDIALLPVGGTYTMTADEAVQAVLDIKPKVAIPMHYGSVVGTVKDAEHFKESLKGKVDVVILKQE